MTGSATRDVPAGAGAPARDVDPPDESRPTPGPLLVAVVTAVAVAAGMLWRNVDIFRIPLYEVGDAAANSLLVNDAKALDLLVGHYSRVGFNHPGPAALYLQAAGEVVFTDLLGLTPAAHNGQLVAVMLLHAVTLGAVAGVVHSWSRRWPVTAAGVAAVLVWYGTHQYSLAGAWIPVLVIPPFLLLLVVSASVASGRSQHLWLLAATGGLLVHAHVAFVLPVIVLATAAVVTWALTARLTPVALVRAAPRAWAVAGAVVAGFLAPIALNTVANWPGEVPKYLDYSDTQEQGGQAPTLGMAFLFTHRAWTATQPSPGETVPLLVAVAVVALAVTVAALAPRGLRGPLLLLTATTLLAQALFVVYAYVGIDDLNQTYIGFFGRSLPAALLLVVAAAAVSALAGARSHAVRGVGAAVGAVAGVVGVLAAGSPAAQVRPEFTQDVPVVVDAVVAAAGGDPLLLDVGDGLGPFVDATSLLLHAERTGVAACVLDPDLGLQVTPERVCTPEETAAGRRVLLRPDGSQEAPTTRAGFSDITVSR